MTRYIIPLLAAILLLGVSSEARAQPIQRDSLLYIVQMESGDSFRGNLVDYTDSTLTVVTEFGRVTLAKRLISRFVPVKGPYLNPSHHFLMPTAAANGPGGFISDYELGFIYGGVGLGSGATITAGMTIIPGIALKSQFYHAGAKFTVTRNDEFEVAIGAAYTFFTTDYPYAHVYGVGTFPIGTGRYSVMVFAKVSGSDVAPIAFQFFQTDTTRFTIFYTGSLGAGFGFDAPAFGRDNLRWVGEIWNNDVQRPQNTVSMLGIRLLSERVSADFGLALSTAPFIVPITRFGYRW